MNALWTVTERTVSERRSLCELWTRANGERKAVNDERKTVNDERTLNAHWTDDEWTVNERNNGKVERFRDCNYFTFFQQKSDPTLLSNIGGFYFARLYCYIKGVLSSFWGAFTK